jgi:hypothetical protein
MKAVPLAPGENGTIGGADFSGNQIRYFRVF